MADQQVTERVALRDLVEDLSVYPRGSVSDVRVADLVYAMDAGAHLPPLVADRATLKIIDGFHRARAYRKRLGDGATVEVILSDYAGHAEMLLASAKLNTPHGLPLSRYDQRILRIKAKELGASDEEIAGALGVTVHRLLLISTREATSDAGAVALKRGTEHLGGSYLTAEQVAEIRRIRGAPAKAKVAEITRMLRQNLMPVGTDPELRAALRDLAALIGETVMAEDSAK